MIKSEVLEKAILFAVKKHKGQKRKGDGKPYILHPISVMKNVYENKKSKNIFLLAAAAVLHDTVEDAGVSLEKISRKFGFSVASLVEELTLNSSEVELIGKTKYLGQKVLKMSSYALTIKLSDRLDNVSDLECMNEEFKKKYKLETNYLITELEEKRKLTKVQKKLITKIKKLVK